MQAIVVGHAMIRATNRSIYRALTRRGVDVTLVVPTRWPTPLGDLQVEDEPEESGVRVVARRRWGRAHSNCYVLAGSLAPLVAPGAPAAFYVDEDPAGFAAGQAARAARRAGAGLVVLAIQNIFKRYPPPFSALQRSVLRAARAAVSTSAQAASVLRRRGYGGPVVPVPFATDLAPLSPRQREEVRARYGLGAPLAGYVGRLVPEKGVDTLIDALGALPGARGAIVGDGPARAELEARARAAGLAERLIFLGALAPSQAAEVMGALDCLVLPSRTTRAWSEQFGRVLIEAMACGVPVVASAGGAIPEVVGDAGILVAEGDVSGFARSIDRVLSTGAGRDLAGRGRARAARLFSIDAAAAALHTALLAAAPTEVA
ncbi:glycosyltransferase [bacterium]|nr:MAG: glycosyltransferase [bacterium]